MEKLEFTFSADRFDDASALPSAQAALLAAARSAMEKAYAPYSRFRVGAAVQLSDGTIVQGNNQENMAYPSGLCAERVAVFAASAAHPGMVITMIAITASSPDFVVDHPVAPCGACRQSLLEYELHQNEPIIVLLQGAEGKVLRISSVRSLLPLFFFEKDLLHE